MPKIVFITAEETIDINKLAVKESGEDYGVVYEGTVYFAEAEAKNRKDLVSIAVSYFYRLTTGHAFIAGNKRTAFLTCLTFLEKNGYTLDFRAKEGIEFGLKVAENKLDYEDVKVWIENNLKKK